jgi:RNA polymerase sigma-70 factor (ECF subfamily)
VHETTRPTGALQKHIELAANGDKSSFRKIFEHLNERLFSYAFSHLHDREAALDVVQETFVDLWQQLPKFQYRSDEEFLGFVFLVLKRKIARQYNKKKHSTYSLDEYIETVGETKEMSHEEPQFDHRRLLLHVEQLSEGSKEVLMLRYWSELSFKEIGEVLGIQESAAKVRHHRALEVLRTYSEEYEHP